MDRVLAAGMTLAITGRANAAAPPRASCPGQKLSLIALVFGADLGEFIAFEARNPERGAGQLRQEISAFAQADRGNCPEE